MFKIKFFITWVICALIVIYFSVATLSDVIKYNRLYNNYKEVYFNVTQSLVDSDDHSMIINDANMEKIKELNNIITEIQNKCVLGKSRRSGFNRIYNAQTELEMLIKLPKPDEEKLRTIYSDLLITRDMLRN